jgi:hypothetical protein
VVGWGSESGNVALSLVKEELTSSVTRSLTGNVFGYNIPQSVLHSLKFLKMGKIDARNVLS